MLKNVLLLFVLLHISFFVFCLGVVQQWILFLAAGHYPRNSPVKFRGDSGLQDGNLAKTDLTGGFYDSGNNIKFTFTTAYTVTLLSWTVVEYRSKYADIGELDHVRDIIRWGSDYLLKVFIPPSSTAGSNLTLFSQASYKFLWGMDLLIYMIIWQLCSDFVTIKKEMYTTFEHGRNVKKGVLAIHFLLLVKMY